MRDRTSSAVAPSPAVRGRMQMETYVSVNGTPSPKGMCRSRGVRRCVLVLVLQLSLLGIDRVHICTLSRYLPSIVDFPMVFLTDSSSFRPGTLHRQNGLEEASVLCRWLCPETGATSGLTVCSAGLGKRWPSSDSQSADCPDCAGLYRYNPRSATRGSKHAASR